MVNVILASKRLQLLDADLKLYSSVTYTAMDGVSPATSSFKYVGFAVGTAAQLRASAFGAGTPTTIEMIQWAVRIQLRTGLDVMIPLGQVENQPTWTNDQDGYEIAEAAINNY